MFSLRQIQRKFHHKFTYKNKSVIKFSSVVLPTPTLIEILNTPAPHFLNVHIFWSLAPSLESCDGLPFTRRISPLLVDGNAAPLQLLHFLLQGSGRQLPSSVFHSLFSQSARHTLTANARPAPAPAVSISSQQQCGLSMSQSGARRV